MTQVVAGNGEKVLFESSDAHEAISWSLHNSPITLISEGQYYLSAYVAIPSDDITLIVGEGAELITKADAHVIKVTEDHGGYYPLIYNGGHDNVKVLNFGTLNPASYQGEGDHVVNVCIMYDGRNGGGNGIDGGMIFSCGYLETTGDALWIVDAVNVEVPFAWSRTTSNTIGIEGGDSIRLGTIIELNSEGRPKGKGRHGNEAVDLNSYCRDLHCELAIGTAPLEEMVDINNSTNCIFEEVRAYGQCNRLVKFTTYKPHQRRLTQKAYIDNSEGTVFNKKVDCRDYVLKSWETEFNVGDLVQTLPLVDVSVKLTGHFENYPTEGVFSKTYQLDVNP